MTKDLIEGIERIIEEKSKILGDTGIVCINSDDFTNLASQIAESLEVYMDAGLKVKIRIKGDKENG